jgi:hypothetical protein
VYFTFDLAMDHVQNGHWAGINTQSKSAVVTIGNFHCPSVAGGMSNISKRFGVGH